MDELLGQPKAKETLHTFLSASSILSLKLGRVDVRFHQPWSLRSFIEQQISRFQHAPKADNTLDDNSRLLHTLAYKVLSDINDVSVIMPTALVGTTLLTLRGRGVGKMELVRRVDWLRQRISRQHGRVAHFGDLSTDAVVERALEVLGSQLVEKVDGLEEATYRAVDRFKLSFYRNMTIHLFVLPALVSAAMYTKIKQGGPHDQQHISIADLLRHVEFLSLVSCLFCPPNSSDRMRISTHGRDAVLKVCSFFVESSYFPPMDLAITYLIR